MIRHSLDEYSSPVGVRQGTQTRIKFLNAHATVNESSKGSLNGTNLNQEKDILVVKDLGSQDQSLKRSEHYRSSEDIIRGIPHQSSIISAYQFKTINPSEKSGELPQAIREKSRNTMINRLNKPPFTGEEQDWKKFEKFNLKHIKDEHRNMKLSASNAEQSFKVTSDPNQQPKNVNAINIESETSLPHTANSNLTNGIQNHLQEKSYKITRISSQTNISSNCLNCKNLLQTNPNPKPAKNLVFITLQPITIAQTDNSPPIHNRVLQTELAHEKQKIQLHAVIKKLQLQINNLQQDNQHYRLKVSAQQQKIRQLSQNQRNLMSLIEDSRTNEKELQNKIRILSRKTISSSKSIESQNSRISFDDALKDQLMQIAQLRQQIDQKQQQIQNLSETIDLNKRKAEQAINNARVDQIKHLTQLKHMQQKHDIAILNKDNRIKTLQHGLETVQAKLKVAISESRIKDNFLQQHLVGRTSGQQQNYVRNILSSYQQEFPVDRIMEKLLEEQRQISQLKQQLALK